MTPDELVLAAEAKLADAERNLASCANALTAHAVRSRGVPNSEVLALAHAQTTLGQAYATLAMAKLTAADIVGQPDGELLATGLPEGIPDGTE